LTVRGGGTRSVPRSDATVAEAERVIVFFGEEGPCMPFKHILVPVDLSDRNTRTLSTARELARQSRGRVTLLHVVHRIPHLPADELTSFYRRLEKASRRTLERALERFAAEGVPAQAQVLIGEPAAEIVAAAARNRVDLIVMGSHRVAARRPGRGWGTTSYKVGILCRCPVLLVK
jgi:nucleotide-binding universal stress UspA family protein